LQEWESKIKARVDSPSKDSTSGKSHKDIENLKLQSEENKIENELMKQRKHRLFVEKQVKILAQEKPEALAEKSNYILKRINTKNLK
jgi:hypothetical protein